MAVRMDGSKARLGAAGLSLLVLGFLAFGGALRCGFVHYDDDLYVFNNPQVLQGLSGSGVRWAFTTGHAGNWHPLTWLSLMADAEWCGDAPRGYHATNVVLHALNGMLLFFALRKWTGRIAWPWLAAALWAVHPLRAESVAWISERKDVLAAFFGLLALGAYGRHPARGRMGGVALFFALSLLAKPTWVTLPFVLLLVDVWPLERWPAEPWRKLAAEKWLLFLMAGASAAVTLLVQHAGGAVLSIERLPFGQRLGNAAVAAIWYVRAGAWPVDLAVHYPLPADGHSAFAVGGSSALLLLFSVGAAWAWRRGGKGWGIGWLWFLGTLVPMIGLVQVGGQAWADRYSYLPHIGLTLALTWGAGQALDRLIGPICRAARCTGPAELTARGRCLKPVLLAGALALVAGLAWQSRRQTAVWQGSETLFAHALQATDRNARVHGALGFAYAAEGRNEEALAHLNRTLELQPDNVRALNNLAWIRATAPDATPQQLAEAVELARRAADQVRKARAAGWNLEAGVETAVMDTLEKAERRFQTPGPPGPP